MKMVPHCTGHQMCKEQNQTATMISLLLLIIDFIIKTTLLTFQRLCKVKIQTNQFNSQNRFRQHKTTTKTRCDLKQAVKQLFTFKVVSFWSNGIIVDFD